MNVDVVVIGAGPGGYVAAVRAAQLGFKTVCIEKEKSLGGTCLNVGCIPSKELLSISEIYASVKNHGDERGLKVSKLNFDFKTIQENKGATIKGLTDGINSIFKRKNVLLIEGKALFISPNTVVVGNQEITAKYFIIATGSLPISLPGVPFDEKRILSSTGALNLPKVPQSMIVVGAGVIGVELASVYSRFGADVTLIEMLPCLCPGLDGEIQRQYTKILKNQGLKFYFNAKVESIKSESKQVQVDFSSQEGRDTMTVDVVLISIGRKPNTEGLGLDKAEVALSEKGMVLINDRFQTSQPHIYAIGDVVDGPMLAHKASEEGVAVAEILAGHNPQIQYATIPNVIYTEPEVSSVGFTEEEAKELNIPMLIGKCPFKAVPRARVGGHPDGMIKIIGHKDSKVIIGAHILGPHASELIAVIGVAMDNRMTLKELGAVCMAHPTLSEGIKEATLAAIGDAIHL